MMLYDESCVFEECVLGVVADCLKQVNVCSGIRRTVLMTYPKTVVFDRLML